MGQFRLRALYGVFFISGFCGLIYESIWSHYLKLLLGHAAYVDNRAAMDRFMGASTRSMQLLPRAPLSPLDEDSHRADYAGRIQRANAIMPPQAA